MALSSSPSSENNFWEKIHKNSTSDNVIWNMSRAQMNNNNNTTPNPRRSAGAPGAFQFDILSWYPKYQSCQRFFLDHAQHDMLVQAFASFINILLPFQRRENPVFGSSGAKSREEHRHNREMLSPGLEGMPSTCPVSLIPYIRRLVATGMDVPQILHGFFGDDWAAGIGPQREQERRNYLFAARTGDWASVKRDYDILPLESVPFLRPLHDPSDAEMEAADKSWNEWLAVRHWSLGPRAPG